jgi:hypothetical protein
MLDAQVQIYEGTQRLDKVPEAERDRDDAIEAGRLSQKEAEIALEADKALNVRLSASNDYNDTLRIDYVRVR